MFSSCLIICKDSNYSYKINLKDIYNITRVGTFFDWMDGMIDWSITICQEENKYYRHMTE